MTTPTQPSVATAADPAREPWANEPATVLRAVGSSHDGLSEAEHSARLSAGGPNELPPPTTPPAWRRFLKHFDDVLIYILVAAAVLKAITGEWVDFTVIVVVIVANAVIGFVQEGRAADALASLKGMVSTEAQALRGGAWGVVDAAGLVVGDVVRVRSGDRVPADLRVLESSNLQVDEAALTGESVPATKDVRTVGADAGVGDRSCMLFSGTIVTTGTAVGVVVSTGSGTEIGKISTLVAEMDQMDTPLSRQLAHLGKQISILIGLLAAVMLVVGRVIHNFELHELVSAAIGFAVAAVPEGLPALVTITLALGVQQMAKRKAITRRMASVETLGSVTVICSDKTGTLTQNEMTAHAVVTAVGRYEVEGTGYQPVGRVRTALGATADLARHGDLAALVTTFGLCNDARVEETEQGWRVVGQPTEGALDVLAVKAGVDLTGWERIAQVPFESAHKFSATLDQPPAGAAGAGDLVVHLMGAPDRLLDRSATQRSADGSTGPLERSWWEDRIEELSAQGLRVLAAAMRPASADDEQLTIDDVASGMTFLGIVGIIDPPRPEATAAIEEAHEAGIRVKMITGDHQGTAVAIARELGIAPPTGEVASLTGAELEAMTQDELRQRAQSVDVYARTSPEHKLRIVRALQSQGEVVAMTGDGVNDAPSITRADVGVAMGVKGTEATKEAADIVLADDNFATIERAVEEGRRIYDNIRKSVVFLLPTNGAQALVILVAVMAGWALPLTPVQILWVNLATAVTLSLSLAGEPAEPGIMKRAPRNPKEQVLSPRILTLVLVASVLIGGATLALFVLERDVLGATLAEAQTTAVWMLALGQLVFLFNTRFLSRSSLTWRVLVGNKVVWISAAALIVLQFAFTYAPFMNDWFGSAPVGPSGWGVAAGFAAGVFLLAELAKWISRTVTAPADRMRTLAARRRAGLAELNERGYTPGVGGGHPSLSEVREVRAKVIKDERSRRS